MTTVKTGQSQGAAACLGNATSSEPSGHSTQELSGWSVVDTMDQAEHRKQLTHINAAEAMLSGALQPNKRGGKKAKSSRELSHTVGNDQIAPWIRPKATRGYEIDTFETLSAYSFLTSAALPTYASAAFTISQVNDFASYSAVFDQYRITQIELLIEPQVTEVITPTQDVAEWVSVIDVDDATVPTSYADVCSYSSAVQSRGTMAHYHRFVPSVAVAVYSGTFTSFAATTSMWLDCGSPNIQHYGIKAASQASGGLQTYTLNVRFHVSWRARH